jgi:hypothetical protein
LHAFRQAKMQLPHCPEDGGRGLVLDPHPALQIQPAQTWLTPTVMQITQAINDLNNFEHLPFLTDALEDAGCDNADLLAHCRQSDHHEVGCWVLDLLLGKP